MYFSLSRSVLIFALMVGVSVGTMPLHAKQSECQVTNPALQAMPAIEVTIIRRDGTSFSFNAKLADTSEARAAGFQRVCESTMKESPILFTFGRPSLPNFHMNNVLFPIDIAFIKQSSKIDSIHHMKTYSFASIRKPLYAPRKPVIAALETNSGFYQQHNVDLKSKITWRLLDAE